MVVDSNKCCLLQDISYSCRVSSTLDNNSTQYGKQYMFDDCEDTCWNSKEGSPQWVYLHFGKEINVSKLEIQFQGGFASKEVQVFFGENLNKVHTLYPEDKNSVQHFPVANIIKTKSMKLVFNDSTDLFGRIIIYKLCVH